MVVGGCGWFFLVVVDGCGSLWVVVDGCRSLWVVAYFNITHLDSQNLPYLWLC